MIGWFSSLLSSFYIPQNVCTVYELLSVNKYIINILNWNNLEAEDNILHLKEDRCPMKSQQLTSRLDPAIQLVSLDYGML